MTTPAKSTYIEFSGQYSITAPISTITNTTNSTTTATLDHIFQKRMHHLARVAVHSWLKIS